MQQDLINMICTRICHDLVSSSQGLMQGIESLDDSDKDFVEQSKQFLKDSAESLNAKLVFFRQLCGRVGKLSTVSELLNIGGQYINLFNKRVYKTNYKITGDSENLILLKAGLAFCSIATDTLIRGGELSINIQNDNLLCEMKGDRMKLNPLIFSALNGDLSNIDPKSAIAGYLHLLLLDEGYKLEINTVSEEEIKFIIKNI